jgi:hypothetical protein
MPAKSGTHYNKFPKADLVKKSVNESEEYYYIKNAGLHCIGKVYDAPYLQSGKLMIEYTPSYKLYKGDAIADRSSNNVYDIRLRFSLDDFKIPIGGFSNNTDSIMIEIDVNEKLINVEEGTLLFNSSSRKAVKQEYEITTTNRIKYKLKGNKTWLDDFTKKLKDMPQNIVEYIKQPQSRVVFLSNEYKGVTIGYEIVNDEIKNLRFQDHEVSPSSLNLQYQDQNVMIMPNPSFGEVTLYLLNLPYDTYTLEVYNLIGKKVLTKTIRKDMGTEIATDLTSLKRGTYIYSLYNSRKERIATKRLIINSI